MESKLETAFNHAALAATETENDLEQYDPDERLLSTFYQLDKRVAQLQINYEVFKYTKGLKNNGNR